MKKHKQCFIENPQTKNLTQTKPHFVLDSMTLDSTLCADIF
ncbi:hypothetical protein [Helicobacter fennelliae]|uniref:Uncharacterized protein n=1 Tax=Helicobacter fennelliae MRY12-0050 TaxID=1325130 RepID=T1D241_9HELI|nr:hypothetical protein [Helicobacter fennelliae]GAD19296.1 hypothetical protein HFN_0427 [Helicobacter fennelliae MRY12-0050]